MARKIPVKNGIPIGWRNRLLVDIDLQELLVLTIVVIIPAIIGVLLFILS